MSKTYYNEEEQTVTTEISCGFFHYEDENGNYEEIDETIVPSSGGGYEVTKGIYEAKFSSNLGNASWPLELTFDENISLKMKP